MQKGTATHTPHPSRIGGRVTRDITSGGAKCSQQVVHQQHAQNVVRDPIAIAYEPKLVIWRGFLQVFAPLARRLGLHSIKEELEELGFMYSDPDNYKLVCERMKELASEHELSLQQARLVRASCVFSFKTCSPGRSTCQQRSIDSPARMDAYAWMRQHVSKPDLCVPLQIF